MSYETFMGAKSFHITSDKDDGFIKICDRTRYLLLFWSEKYDAIYDRKRYLISQKSGTAYSIRQILGKIRIDSYNSLLFCGSFLYCFKQARES